MTVIMHSAHHGQGPRGDNSGGTGDRGDQQWQGNGRYYCQKAWPVIELFWPNAPATMPPTGRTSPFWYRSPEAWERCYCLAGSSPLSSQRPPAKCLEAIHQSKSPEEKISPCSCQVIRASLILLLLMVTQPKGRECRRDTDILEKVTKGMDIVSTKSLFTCCTQTPHSVAHAPSCDGDVEKAEGMALGLRGCDCDWRDPALSNCSLLHHCYCHLKKNQWTPVD